MTALNPQLADRAKLVFLAFPADHELTVLDDCPLSQFFFAAEIKDRRLRRFLHSAGCRIIIIEDKKVFRRLLGKYPLLHLLIDFHRAMTHDMVWCHIQNCSYMRMEIRRCLHLIARDLCGYTASAAHPQCFLRQWCPNIATNTDRIESCCQQLSEQGNCRGLAIGACHSTNRRLCELIGKLNLSGHADMALIRCLNDGNTARDSRRHQYETDTIQQ